MISTRSIVKPSSSKARIHAMRRILGIQAANAAENGLIRAQLDRSVRFAKGRDNRYASDSTMVIVNQGILKIWQDICWLAPLVYRVTPRLAVPPIKYSIMPSNNRSDFRRVMVIAGIYSGRESPFSASILRRYLFVFSVVRFTHSRNLIVTLCLTSREKIVKYSHKFS